MVSLLHDSCFMIQSKAISKLESIIFYLLILFLPTQLGKHFWTDFSIVSGIRVDYLAPTLYFTDILVILLFLTTLLNRFQKTRKTQQVRNVRRSDHLKFRKSGFLSILSVPKEYLFFFIFLLLNIYFSHNILNGLYYLLKLLEFSFVGFYVATSITSFDKLKKIVLCLAIGAIFESLLAIAQFINQGSFGGVLYFFGERTFSSSTPGIANTSINGELLLRPYATFPHPNVLAGFLLCVMVLSLWSFGISKKRWEKLFFFLSILLGTGALILTMSRAAIVLWIIVLAFSVFNFPSAIKINFKNLKSSKMANKLKVLVIFGLLIAVLISTPVGNRLLSTRLTEESVVQRQELTVSSFKLFSQSPIIGIGLGNFIPSLASFQKILSPTLYFQPVHNIFLLILSETGIIGFGFFVWFLIKTYRYLLENIRTHTIFLVLLTTVLLLALLDHYFITIQQGQLIFAVVFGLCWSCFAYRA